MNKKHLKKDLLIFSLACIAIIFVSCMTLKLNCSPKREINISTTLETTSDSTTLTTELSTTATTLDVTQKAKNTTIKYIDKTTTVQKTKLNKNGFTYLGKFKLTFYCGGSCCNGKWAGQTCTGNPMIEGRTIAVDKTVIPLGSDVYIEGFGWFVAEDVGGGIRGNHIDIYISSHEKIKELGGVQYRDVYVK